MCTAPHSASQSPAPSMGHTGTGWDMVTPWHLLVPNGVSSECGHGAAQVTALSPDAHCGDGVAVP